MANKNTFKFYVTSIFVALTFILNAQNTWTPEANFGGGDREGACGFVIGNTGYYATGLKIDTDCGDLWAWNQTSNTWTKQAPFMGGVRMGSAATSLGGYGYLSGGEHPSNCFLAEHKAAHGGVCGGTFYYDFWRYSPDSNTWTQILSFPGGGRNYAVMVSDPQDTAIYYGTGNNNGVNYLDDWWVYKVSSATWAQLDSFPGGPRANAIGFYANGNIYLGTGDDGDSTYGGTSDMWQYNIATGKWKQVASLPGAPRRMAAEFTIGNKAFVCEGVSGSAYLNEMWQYDALKDAWTQVATYPQNGGYSATGFAIGNKGYVGLGTVALTDTSTFWEYTPSDTVLGIAAIKNAQGISLYPNPSKGTIQLSYAGLAENSQLKIIDILGNTVDAHTITNSQGVMRLNEANLSNGIYFYQVISAGKQTSTGKFIIAR
ncbi:MAG TPA: kelch repeat-containing protein [Bacteroidia bacterium]|jgi:N-acetylneuraminic acid mutarotase|nr:kelch repeat-containing protein [Bacteroidia bacterium]